MGRNLVDVPHLETVVVAGGLIAAAGGGAHDDLLTAIAAGDAVVVPALFERNGGMHAGDVELATDTASGRLSGSKMYVAFAGQASHFLVAAKDEVKLALFLVPASRPGVTAPALPTISRAPLYPLAFHLPLPQLAP